MKTVFWIPLLGLSTMLALAGCHGPESSDEPADDAAEVGADSEDTGEAEGELVAWCNSITSWDPAWVTLENKVLALVNARRANGAVCGGVTKPPVPALTRDKRLRCAARKHSRDMGRNDFFSHTGSNGSKFSQRMTWAGYSWTAAAENIGAGQNTAAAVVSSWMASSGHCKNLMSASYKHIGIGYYDDDSSYYGQYWTQDFGKP